jgi:probable rRNA maturation factor
MSVAVANESGIAVDERGLADVAMFVLAEMGINPLAELSLLVVDEEHMSALHEHWMDEPGPTDVLAFPMDELGAAPGRGDEAGEALLGDVVLCPAVAARQAATAGHSTAAELRLLTTHGILHLLGYDHAEPEDKKRMFSLQDKLIAGYAGGPVAP